ncbi:MAG: toll/interleukin-1 receptor domain-containing protein [Anaerolineae bacterium]|nr:toll/interleukin-1 receptor domain-containing protein [Anaerolineae bacterium]
MDSSDPIQLNIEVSASDATEDEIDRMTRQLLLELRGTDVESAELAKGGLAPKGSKGDAVTIGSIVLDALPGVLPAVIALVQAWSTRGQGRTVKFKSKEFEFEGSPEELRKLLASPEAEHFTKKEKRLTQKKEAAERKTRKDTDKLGPVQAKSKTTRSSRIFISYRRADSADITGRIYDRLIGHFGESAIFKDVDSIPAGIDFKKYLDKAVSRCQVFLVVIGNQWLEITDSRGRKRLQDPSDFVRIEVESALERNIPVIPLLVGGASMPSERKLPPSLQKLVYRNGIPIRSDPDFHRDMDRLIEAISSYPNKKS